MPTERGKRYRLKYIHRYIRSFRLGFSYYNTEYDKWALYCGRKELREWSVTADSHLSAYLQDLCGSKKYYLLKEEDRTIVETMFRHTKSWKLFLDASVILEKKGKKKSFEYLKEKLVVMCLADKLKV